MRAPGSEPPTLGRWVKATTLGWLLGFVLILAMAMALDAVGVSVQFVVGAGIGGGVGLLQARTLRGWLDRPGRWAWATTLGMMLPFAVWDLEAALGGGGVFASLYVCVALGSPIVGLVQAALLRSRLDTAFWWVPASVAGWCAPVAAMRLGESGLLGAPGVALYLGSMLLGGALLGAITGAVLVRMPRRGG